jgi:hypothetical protein
LQKNSAIVTGWLTRQQFEIHQNAGVQYFAAKAKNDDYIKMAVIC